MIINIKSMVLTKFGTSGMLYEDFRAEMLWKSDRLLWMHAGAQEILILTCTEHASTTSPDDETQKYDF